MADLNSLMLDSDSLNQLSSEDLDAFQKSNPGAQINIAQPIRSPRSPDDPPDLDFDSISNLPAEDLAAFATQTKWSPYGWAQSNPEKLDENILTKLANTDLILRKQGFKLSDIPVGTVLSAIPTLVKGMGVHLGKSLTAAISPVVEVTGALPEGVAMQAGAKAAGEMLAGTEAAATGFADLFRRGFDKLGRFIGTSKSLDEFTEADARQLFNNELAIRNQLATIVSGEGEATKFLGGQTLRDLKSYGVALDPKEIEASSHGDPFTFAAFTGGFKILNGTTGKVVGFAANKSGAVQTIRKLRALRGVEKAAEKLVEQVPSAENIAAAQRATIALGAERAAGIGVIPTIFEAGERAIEKLPTATGVLGKGLQATGTVVEAGAKLAPYIGGLIGVLKGGPIGGLFGSGAGGTIGRVARTVGRSTAEFGQRLAIPEAAGGTWMRAIQDVIKAPGAVAAGMARGFPIDLGLLAVSAETPEEARESPFLGTAFGGVGGLLRAGRGFIQGQQIAPRPWGQSSAWQKSYGNFPELDAAHAEAMRIASPGIKQRIGALRDLADTTGAELYQFSGPESMANFLVNNGWDANTARDYANANGVTLGPLIDKSGGGRKVILIRDPISAPHEVGHPILDTLTPEHKDVLLDKVIEHYGDQQVLQRAQQEASALATTPEAKAEADLNWQNFLLRITGDGPDSAKGKVEANPELANRPWDLVLTDAEKLNLVKRYASNEILADTVDTVLRHGTPELLQDAKFPGFVSRVLSRLLVLSGADPYAGVTAESPFVTPIRQPVAEAVRATVEPFAAAARPAARPVVEPAVRQTPGEVRPAPTPGGVPVSPEAIQEAAIEARTIADTASDVPAAAGQRSAKELLGEIADAIAQRVGVKLNYLSAPDEPAAAITASRTARRAAIEAFRSMPPAARALWEKNFFPERVLRTPGGTLQVLGWAPEVFAANAHRTAQALSAKAPELSPYPIDAKIKSFTEAGWRQLYEDTKTFVENQISGRTGAGGALVVPETITERGFFKPPIAGEAAPLEQRKADFINMLFGIPLPKTPRITSGRLPLSIAGQEVSTATLPGRISIPVEPRVPFGGEAAERLGIAGREILEVNPVRAEIEQAGIKLPGLIEAVQRLNAENIREVAIAPEQPQFRGNILTLTAGFQPKPENPQAIKSAAVRLPDKKVFEGEYHGDAYSKAQDAGYDLESAGAKFEDGFVTNSGEFLDRLQAMERAIDLKQIKEEDTVFLESVEGPGTLESVDLQRKRQFQPAGQKTEAEDLKPLPVGPGQRRIIITGPDGKQYPARFDGYQEAPWVPEGGVVQITPEAGFPFQEGAFRSTTYGPSLTEKGYKLPEGLPTFAEYQAELETSPKQPIFKTLHRRQFQPKKKTADDLKFEATKFGQASKAWILPNGKIEQLGTVWHHDWLDQNKAIQQKYGLKIPPFEGGDAEGVREAALKKGFSRLNLINGAFTAEVREKDWRAIRPIIEDMVERNLDDIDRVRVSLFDDSVNKINKSFDARIFDLDTNKEKMDKVFETFSELPQTEIAAQFQSSKDPRAIKAVATKDASGKIWKGKPGEIHSNLHDQIFAARAEGPVIDGFVTNSGEFLDREAAFARALTLKQIKPGSLSRSARNLAELELVKPRENRTT